jgi:hypothetical protein
MLKFLNNAGSFFCRAPGLELSSDVIEEILGGEPGN